MKDTLPRPCEKCGAMIQVVKTRAGTTIYLDLAAPVCGPDRDGFAQPIHAFVTHAVTCSGKPVAPNRPRDESG